MPHDTFNFILWVCRNGNFELFLGRKWKHLDLHLF